VGALFEASDLTGLVMAFTAIPRNDGSRSYGQGWGSHEGQLTVDPDPLALNALSVYGTKRNCLGARGIFRR
jgi:hypothetical protein